MNWILITRLGESQFLAPAALLAAGWLAWAPKARGTALAWLLLLAIATILTTASKLAFMGWGIGLVSLDFTGFSGHAMFAAAVYPMLTRMLGLNAGPVLQRSVWLMGAALALLIGASRVVVQAHSVSEVVGGSMLGLAASGFALRWHPLGQARNLPWGPLLPPVLLGVLAALAWQAPPTFTHQALTHFATTLSQRPQPYTRADLHHPPPPPTPAQP